MSNSSVPDYYPENITIAYDSSLGCGACIRGGYTYCTTAKEGTLYSTTPTGTCCKSNSTSDCSVISNSAYTCSSAYSSKTYAKFVCPFITSKCGSTNNITLDNTGDSFSISLSLTAGDTCFYQINAKCGIPEFTPSNTTGFDIDFIDYADDEMSNRTNRSSGRPMRNQSFGSRGNSSRGNRSGNNS